MVVAFARRIAVNDNKRRSPWRLSGVALTAAAVVVLLLAYTTVLESKDPALPMIPNGLASNPHAAVVDWASVPVTRVLKLMVAVFPGDVLGLDHKDRYHRIRAIQDTWGTHTHLRLRPDTTLSLEIVHVRDYAKPLREEALPAATFLDRSVFANTSTPLQLFLGVCDLFLKRATETAPAAAAAPEEDGGSASERVAPDAAKEAYLLLMHDHTLLIPENLGCLLAGLTQPTDAFPYFIGSKLRSGRDSFVSLPAGTLLSVAAVQLFRAKADAKACVPAAWQHAQPSHFLAECLYDHGVRINTGATDTESAAIAAAAVGFSVYGPVREFSRAYDEWYVEYKGADKACCAMRPITYHYTDHPEVRYIHRVLDHRKAKLLAAGRSGAPMVGTPSEQRVRAEDVSSMWPKRQEPYSLLPDARAKDPAVMFLANEVMIGQCGV